MHRTPRPPGASSALVAAALALIAATRALALVARSRSSARARRPARPPIKDRPSTLHTTRPARSRRPGRGSSRARRRRRCRVHRPGPGLRHNHTASRYYSFVHRHIRRLHTGGSGYRHNRRRRYHRHPGSRHRGYRGSDIHLLRGRGDRRTRSHRRRRGARGEGRSRLVGRMRCALTGTGHRRSRHDRARRRLRRNGGRRNDLGSLPRQRHNPPGRRPRWIQRRRCGTNRRNRARSLRQRTGWGRRCSRGPGHSGGGSRAHGRR